jgi:hypothetical protein
MLARQGTAGGAKPKRKGISFIEKEADTLLGVMTREGMTKVNNAEDYHRVRMLLRLQGINLVRRELDKFIDESDRFKNKEMADEDTLSVEPSLGLNIFTRFGAGLIELPRLVQNLQYLLPAERRDEFLVLKNQRENAVNYTSSDVQWHYRAGMSRHHEFMILKNERDWLWFNALTVGMEHYDDVTMTYSYKHDIKKGMFTVLTKEDNRQRTVARLERMRETAMAYIRACTNKNYVKKAHYDFLNDHADRFADHQSLASSSFPDGLLPWSSNVELLVSVHPFSPIKSFVLHLVDLDHRGPCYEYQRVKMVTFDEIISTLKEEDLDAVTSPDTGSSGTKAFGRMGTDVRQNVRYSVLQSKFLSQRRLVLPWCG